MLRYICIIVGSFAGKMCQITAEQKMFFMWCNFVEIKMVC
jgi:hypothetical protein